MEIIQKTIHYNSRSKRFNIIPVGDTHIGNIGFDKEHFIEIRDYIKNTPDTYWIGMGDYCENISYLDKRFDPRSIDKSYRIKDLSNLALRQEKDLLKMLLPIKDKCLAVLSGNHEEKMRLQYQLDIGLDLARNLDAPYMGYNGFIKLRFLRKKNESASYVIYTSHGHGASRKSGAKVNKLEDYASFIDADIIILAHEHKKIIAPPIIRLGLDRLGRLRQKKQLGIMSGSFLRGYVPEATSYVEKAGYHPSDLGVVKIMIKPDVKDIHCSL